MVESKKKTKVVEKKSEESLVAKEGLVVEAAKKPEAAEKRPEVLGKKQVRKVMAEENLPPRPNHRGRGRTPAEKRQIYAEYTKRKKIVYEAEERNTEYLVLFLASDGDNPNAQKKFYVMGGNSAVIYAYDIAPRIGRKSVVLRPDLDAGYYKFKHGVTSISNLELLTEKLKELGIERMPIDNNDLIVYFRLKRKYEKDDIKALLKLRRDEIKEMNKILYTDVVFPDIHKQTMELRNTVYHKLVKMQRTDREILQEKILEPVFGLSDTYALMAHGDMKIREAGREMVRALDILMDRVAMLGDLDLLDVSSCARIGKIAAGLKILTVGKMVNRSENVDADDSENDDKGEAINAAG